MKETSGYFSIAEAAELLRISRVAVYKKVKKGELNAVRIGKFYAIPREIILRRVRAVQGHTLQSAEKEKIRLAVAKTIKDYGEVLKKLGAE